MILFLSKKIEVKYEGRDLYLSFPEEPGTMVKTDLPLYGFIPDNSSDTIWKLKEFELNHQMAFLSFDYLEHLGYEIIKSDSLVERVGTLKSKTDISELASIGLEIKENKETSPLAIPGFKRELKEYQILPVKHMVSLRSAANFSVPGSGKTTIVLAGYALLKNENLVNKMLVIGPYSSLMPWKDEVEACFYSEYKPLITRIHGSRNHRYSIYLNDKLNSKFEIFITTYQTAHNDIDFIIDLVQKYNFLIVLDESHKIKNIEGKISSTILKLCTFSSFKMILTGTPIPNSIEDIYSQITFLYPASILGDKSRFKYLSRKKNREMVDYITGQINPFFTRISKNQMNLPKPNEYPIKVEMSDVQINLYKLVSERWHDIIEISEMLEDMETINDYKKCLFIRLRQISSNIALLIEKSSEYNLNSLKKEIDEKKSKKDRTDTEILDIINNIARYNDYECSPKLVRTVELVEELKEKGIKKILIWSEFILNLDTIYKYLNEKYGEDRVFLIIGDTPKTKATDLEMGRYTEKSREYYISKFKENSNEFSILIANPQACAESISLHMQCHNAIYLDRSYNCGQFMQSKDRIHRIGVEELDVSTNYYYLISTGEDLDKRSIDEKIHLRLIEKEKDMLKILNDSESFIGSNDPEQEDFEIFYSDI